MHAAGVVAGVVLAGVALAACDPAGDIGYLEIRTMPVALARAPSLYLDATKLEPVQKGVAVLKQRAGTAKLLVEAAGGRELLCDIVVRKNRITTVTVSVLERPPRCQCHNSSANRACIS